MCFCLIPVSLLEDYLFVFLVLFLIGLFVFQIEPYTCIYILPINPFVSFICNYLLLLSEGYLLPFYCILCCEKSFKFNLVLSAVLISTTLADGSKRIMYVKEDTAYLFL